uniref:Uncharacterized protein n=1 Tax=Nelumbo nucifera TaxID=4432 RepID=A0A822ZXA1_NELNU|nr:TPA_asm: hypothetical protein HUJ06_017413 [Nelumbo nucifera]
MNQALTIFFRAEAFEDDGEIGAGDANATPVILKLAGETASSMSYLAVIAC